MRIDGLDLDLTGLHILPGLVNAHDHLEFALFPRLGRRTYANATEWANDIHRPEASPVREHLGVPKRVRLLWGGLRNLLAGVTLVCHHNPWHPVFDNGFPVRVLRRFSWAHSLAFSPDIQRRVAASPFIVHAGEGSDASSAREVFELDRMRLLGPGTVVVHAAGFDDAGWELMRRCGASVVWCPRSNLFTLGRTLDARRLAAMGLPFALATDSALTAEGDLLDEIAFAGAPPEWTGANAHRVLRTRADEGDFIAVREFGAPPELVCVSGRLQLIGERILRRRPQGWSLLHVEGRPPAWVRLDVRTLVAQSREALGQNTLRLAGREVYS